jgi:hypothetical protein
MLEEAIPLAFKAAGAPTGVVPTKNWTVPVGTHEGAEGLHCAGVTVVETTKGVPN